MNYHRFDCVWAGEGPIPQHVLDQALAPYSTMITNLEPTKVETVPIALLTGLPIDAHVFNGQATRPQNYTGVYVENGTIDDAAVEQLRADTANYIVDFTGHFVAGPTEQVWNEEVRLGDGQNCNRADPMTKVSAYSRSLIGTGKMEIFGGRLYVCRLKQAGDREKISLPQPIWDRTLRPLLVPDIDSTGPRQVSIDPSHQIWACTSREEVEALADGKTIREADELMTLDALSKFDDAEISCHLKQLAPGRWLRAGPTERRKMILEFRSQIQAARARYLN